MTPSHAVTIYSFQNFSPAPDGWVQAPYKATRETIEQLGGRILEGTAETVEVNQLDPDGLYRRAPTGWGALQME